MPGKHYKENACEIVSMKENQTDEKAIVNPVACIIYMLNIYPVVGKI